MPTNRRRLVSAAGPCDEYKEHLELLTLRLLLKAGACSKFIGSEGVEGQAIRELLGLNHSSTKPPTKECITERLRKALEDLERKDVSHGGALFTNIRMLGDSLKLNRVERDVLALAVLLETQEPLQECADYLGTFSDGKMVRVLARMLRRKATEIGQALARGGTLFSTGLIALGTEVAPLPLRLAPMKGLSNALLREQENLEELISAFVRKSAAPALTPNDFDYLSEDLRMLQSYLDAAARKNLRGVNVLIYGAPGTGKTELTRVLASMLGKTLYEVNIADGKEQPLPLLARLSWYAVCQKLLAHRRDCLILFDEIEDVFPRERPAAAQDDQKGGMGKAWVNRLLEQNPVPSFWLANEIGQIDRAYLRRFDYALEMQCPPGAVRRRIIQNSLRGIPVSTGWLRRTAANENLTPALIKQAARIAGLCAADSSDGMEGRVERVIRNSMAAQGLRPSNSGYSAETTGYRLEYLNADHDLERLSAALRTHPRGRICLYGPPGTGKTAFAHYLADRLNKSIHFKRASDLFSCWVGETEGKIAQMFRRAEAENALLFLDEADSFLRDRRGAHYSWEIRQVNELMVQMESFSGLFICATNFMESFDSAAFRRFAMKIKFTFLKPDQSWSLLLQILEEINHPIEPDSCLAERLKQSIRRLDNLTPGDFAAVKQRFDMMGTAFSAPDFVAALEQDCRGKGLGQKRRIGFIRA